MNPKLNDAINKIIWLYDNGWIARETMEHAFENAIQSQLSRDYHQNCIGSNVF